MSPIKLQLAMVLLTAMLPAAGLVTRYAFADPPETEPATAPKLPEWPLDKVCRFRVENNHLTFTTTVANDPPIRVVKVLIPGLPGESQLILGMPGVFTLFNHMIRPDHAIIAARIDAYDHILRLQEMSRLPDGAQQTVWLLQAHADTGWNINGQPLKVQAGQALLLIQHGDKTAPEDQHIAPNFIALATENPLAYWRHAAPLLRHFGAKELTPLPPALTRQVLDEPADAKPAAELQPQIEKLLGQLDAEDFDQRAAAQNQLDALGAAAADLLRTMDRTAWSAEQQARIGALAAARLPRATILQLRQDPAFLLDCLDSDTLEIRTAALAFLRRQTGQPLAFDPQSGPEKRAAALVELHAKLTPATQPRP